ncbi:MAG: hypothetical protein WDZ35_01480 [Crocinitomicaceae bacterium]
MQLSRKYKFQLIEVGILFAVFILSLQLRKENVSAPLSPEHEWITAHTLITLEIWEENGGPAAYNFNPIYAYPGKGNRGIAMLGGVSDQEGYHYYVSYPPFSFIFAYYSSQLFGGTDVYHLRAINLIIHFITAFLIYLLIRGFYRNDFDRLALAPLLVACMYLLSTGTLWAHSVLYFADILVQPLILLIFLLFSRIIQQKVKNQSWMLFYLGITIFFAVYTEWIALFMAFFGGLFFFICYLKSRSKLYLKSFVTIALSASLSLGLTVFQYSTISGFDQFKQVSSNKYEERSGHATAEKTAAAFNLENPEAFKLLRANVDRNFLMAENLLGISFFLLLPFLFWRKSRNRIPPLSATLFILSLLLISILIHYLLFYNFNALHNFSNLKTGLFMMLTVGVIICIIEQSVNWKIQGVFSLIVLFFFISRASRDIDRYYGIYEKQFYNADRVRSAKLVHQYADKDLYIFNNIHPSPAYTYTAKHLTFPLAEKSHLLQSMHNFNIDKAQYYHHQGSVPLYFIYVEKLNDTLVVRDSLAF